LFFLAGNSRKKSVSQIVFLLFNFSLLYSLKNKPQSEVLGDFLNIKTFNAKREKIKISRASMLDLNCNFEFF